MKKTIHDEIILNESDIVTGLYSGTITDLSDVNIDDPEIVTPFNTARKLNADFINELQLYTEPTMTVNEYDTLNQSDWFMPDEYKQFDIVDWLFDQCHTPEETNRVAEELELFVHFAMIDVLRYLKYLVDTMRAHGVVWGVGRGSSVASYCLYLLGIHKINSIKYGLDIHEFLK